VGIRPARTAEVVQKQPVRTLFRNRKTQVRGSGNPFLKFEPAVPARVK
jgi:hypothetical protein